MIASSGIGRLNTSLISGSPVLRMSGGRQRADDVDGGGGEGVKELDQLVDEAKKKTSSLTANDSNNNNSRLAGADAMAKNNGQQPPNKEQPADDAPEGDGVSHIQSMPDMTGKIITVSTEETLKLTKERKKSKRRRAGGNDNNNSNSANNNTSSCSAGATAANQEKIMLDQDVSNSDRELMADVEKEFQEFICKLSSAKSCRAGPGAGDGDGDNPPAAGEGGNNNMPTSTSDNYETTHDRAVPRGSNFMSEFTIDTIIDNIEQEAARREKTEITDLTINDIDDTLDSWSKTDEDGGTRRKSEHDTSITAVSESAHDSSNDLNNDCYTSSIHGKNSYTNDSSVGGGGGGANNNSSNNHRRANSNTSSYHRQYQSQLRSSLRRVSDGDNDKLTNGKSEGISWASLIKVDEERKKKTASSSSARTSSARRKGGEKSHLSSSYRSHLSNITTDSKEERKQKTISSSSSSSSRRKGGEKSHLSGSYKSHLSTATVDSSKMSNPRSIRSKGSNDGSKKSNKSGNAVSWKDESVMSTMGQQHQSSSSKDPEHVRKQAKERFERGIHYAERGNFGVAKERFLSALRYRVMRRGPYHPDVAAAHEMLGHVHYFLSLEKTNKDDDDYDDDLRASLMRLDEGEEDCRSGSMSGWDLTILEQKNNGKKDSKRHAARGVYLEKAAMHYQTVLDILGDDQLSDEAKPSARSSANSLSSSNTRDDGRFGWSDKAESYNGLDKSSNVDEDHLGLGTEAVVEIVARVKEKMDLLPVTAMGGKSSYAKTFLDSTEGLCALLYENM